MRLGLSLAITQPACRPWSPAQLTGIDGYVDARFGVTLHPGDRIEYLREQVNGAQMQRLYNDAGDYGGLDSTAYVVYKPLWVSSVFGANPAIRMDATWPAIKSTALRLDTSRILSTGHTFFWVSKHTSTKNTAGHTQQNVPMVVISECSQNTFNGAGFSAGVIAYSYFSGGAWQEAQWGSGYNDGTARLFCVSHTVGGDLKAFVNGVQVGSTVTGADHFGANHTWNCIGSGYRIDTPNIAFDGGDDGFVGDVAFAGATHGEMSLSDQARLYQYAQEEWGIP